MSVAVAVIYSGYTLECFLSDCSRCRTSMSCRCVLRLAVSGDCSFWRESLSHLLAHLCSASVLHDDVLSEWLTYKHSAVKQQYAVPGVNILQTVRFKWQKCGRFRLSCRCEAEQLLPAPYVSMLRMTACTSWDKFVDVPVELAVSPCCMSPLVVSTCDLLYFINDCLDFAHDRSFDRHPYAIVLLNGMSVEPAHKQHNTGYK